MSYSKKDSERKNILEIPVAGEDFAQVHIITEAELESSAGKTI